MDIPDYINIKIVRWPDGRMFGSRIISISQSGELFFTNNWWNYFCRADPYDEKSVIITHCVPKIGIFTDRSKSINTKGNTI